MWADVSAAWAFSAIAVTTSTRIMSMEMPTSMVNLTADPPEDITVLRIVGSFVLSLATANAGVWNLALIVQDHTWTPGATITLDNDKRILWQREFNATAVSGWTSESWEPPDTHLVTGTLQHLARSEAMQVDLTPKVKLEAGKALYLVAYEAVDGGTLTLTSNSMRVLFQRTRRRR